MEPIAAVRAPRQPTAVRLGVPSHGPRAPGTATPSLTALFLFVCLLGAFGCFALFFSLVFYSRLEFCRSVFSSVNQFLRPSTICFASVVRKTEIKRLMHSTSDNVTPDANFA